MVKKYKIGQKTAVLYRDRRKLITFVKTTIKKQCTMNDNLFNRISAVALSGFLAVTALSAKQGAPHTLIADNSFSNLTLSWKSPMMPKTLQWHDGKDYNGDQGVSVDPQRPVTFYVSSLFTADDLKGWVGETIEAITYFQYAPAYKVTVMLYEDDVLISEADASAQAFVKNTSLTVPLPQPVVIAPGKSYRFAVKFVGGQNLTFVAIKDRATDAPGKGDLYSTDGVNWVATGAGDYLITANLKNDVDEDPDGYNIYRGDTKLNDTPVRLSTFFTVDNEEGLKQYQVAAVYGDTEVKSTPIDVTIRNASSVFPAVTPSVAKVDNLNVSLSWAAPLLGGDELTWSAKSIGQSIGGTAASNTKVWVRNLFDADDLVAFAGGKISAINFYFSEAVVSGVTMFIYRDGALVWSEAVPAEAISAIAANQWTQFPLSEPFAIEAGHSYAYGLYVLHTPKAHPIGVSVGETVDVKGNSFSTSSANSSNFLKSNPSWKTLKSGGIMGNWMMTATIQDAPAPLAAPVYDVYRDGSVIKSDLSDTSIDDTVDDLGSYTYSIVAKSGSRTSNPADIKVNVALPAAYAAPLIENSDFDPETKTVTINWNMDKDLRHCGDPYAMASFDEEMSMMWGTQFSASELADYTGYGISKLKFMVGESIGDFKLGVYTKQGVALSEIEIPASAIQPQAVYTVALPSPVQITGTQDLLLAYSGTIPAGVGGIVIDKGPLVDGGSRVSFTNGANWINLGTVNPTYNNYNIFISAMVSEWNVPTTEGESETAGAQVELLAMPTVKADTSWGIEVLRDNAVGASKAAPAAKAPAAVKFNIYRNGEKIADEQHYMYTQSLTDYGVFTYHVTAVYNNGWESKPSEEVVVHNTIAQKAVAPYALTGEVSDKDLILSWKSPDEAQVLTYATGNSDLGLGMTGSGERSSYCAIKIPAAQLESNVGHKISHIRFGLYSTELNSAAVIVMYGENIIYQQDVPVSSLVVGLNDVRLNAPVEIPAATDVCVGYFVTYANGIKPLGMDESAANAGYGDLISSSATPGYWYSLKDKFGMDHNWRIYAIVSTPDSELPLRNMAKADGDSQLPVTYNVYRDGELLAEDIPQETFTVADAKSGRYYVTAVRDGAESGESNAVAYTRSSGVVEIEGIADGSLRYNADTATVLVSQPSDILVYSASGALVAEAAMVTSVDLSHLAAGVYVVTARAAGMSASIKIVR